MGEFSFIAVFPDSRFFDFWMPPLFWREKKNKSQFLFFQTITAEDNGGKSNSATVNIKVEDVNDQSPEFVRVHQMFSRILNYFSWEKNFFTEQKTAMLAFYDLLILILMSGSCHTWRVEIVVEIGIFVSF